MSQENKKMKIMILSDDFRATSGVAHMTRQMVLGLLNTGKFSFLYLCGAMKHENYTPFKYEEHGEDLMCFPIDGYGNPDMIRTFVHEHKPDTIWFMTDPRYYEWLWNFANEIRVQVPLVYYHVWDNYPVPDFNDKFYSSTDVVATISRLTDNIVRKVSPTTDTVYLPHAFDLDVFKKMSDYEAEALREKNFPNKKFIVFWNSRNARRKQSGTLLFWFKEFLNRVGKDNATLIMHTDIRDPVGQDLEAIVHKLELTNGEVQFSTQKLPPQDVAKLYNIADVTVAISDAEGFGLSVGESLCCETPVVATNTGGIPDQLSDGETVFGRLIEPAAKSVVGGLDVPYIYEDRISEKDFVDKLEEMYNMSKEERAEIGKKARRHMEKNFNKDVYIQQWEELLDRVKADYGSWPNKKYERWTMVTK